MSKDFKQNRKKFYYVGISISHAATEETGIAVIDNELNIIRVDKTYRLNDIKFFLENLCGKNGMVIAADIPLNQMFLIGKWRQESKHYQPFTIRTHYKSDQQWSQRQSTRGSDLCKKLQTDGHDVIRFNFAYSKQAMGIASPLQENTPMACKYLQDMLKEKLGLKNTTSNMMPLSSLKALVGAYIAWQTVNGEQDKDFKVVNTFDDLPVVSGI